VTVKESVIERELVRAVEARGGLCLKVTVIGRRGFVDRLVILPGGHVRFVELKRPRGGRVAAHQKQYHRELAALGCVVVIVRDLRDIAWVVHTARL
jgi:Holliday junction resolvase